MSPLRVGIFGGSFNPVHLGHLIQAEEAWCELNLDRLLFVPARFPPHKSPDGLLATQDRVALLRLALEGESRFEISDVDLEREGPSYSVDTIRIIRASLPQSAEVYFLMGADSLLDLRDWRDPDTILKLARVVVFPRAGHDLHDLPPELLERVTLLNAPLIEISSIMIRGRIAAGRSCRYLLPRAVWRCIEERQYYRAS